MKNEPLAVKSKHTQMKISKKLGVSQPTISNWLKLITKPTGLGRQALDKHYPELLERIDQAWQKKENLMT